MQKKQINPWTYQDQLQYGYSQGWEVVSPQKTIYVSGQCSISEEGHLIHEGDFSSQCKLVFDNIRQV